MASTLVASGLMAFPALAQNPVSETREFRDWVISCNNINTCQAFNQQGRAILTVLRKAGPDSAPDLYLEDLHGEEVDLGEVGLSLDGQPPVTVRRQTSGDELMTLDPSILTRLMAAKTLVADFDREGADPTSLSGLTAALLWMDERQGRLGTTTALVRKGQLPASRVPPAPEAPAVPPPPRIDQSRLPTHLPEGLLAAPEVAVCFDPEYLQPDAIRQRLQRAREDFVVMRLSDDRLLWGIPCGQTRQYETEHWLVTSDAEGRKLSTVTLHLSDGSRTDPLASQIDPETMTVSWADVVGGAGPARLARWQWTGTDFVLVEEVRSSHPNPIWPQVYVTR